MSRPKREHILKVRLFDSEREALRQKAEEFETDAATFVRNVAVGPSRPADLPIYRDVFDAITQIRGVSRNINQIAKKINQAEYQDGIDAELLTDSLAELAELDQKNRAYVMVLFEQMNRFGGAR